MSIKTILVTGGTGYIGSHTVVQLINSGYNVVILDNLLNSKSDVVNSIQQITKICPKFVFGDIRDRVLLSGIFTKFKVEAVIHFAGLKSVGESVVDPLKYYENNVVGSLILLEEMARANVKKLVFSSSATVYGIPTSVPIREDFPLSAVNPYGQSKLMVESILKDLQHSDSEWSIACLRYFNPIGAHESGLIGESPNGIPSNLLPYISGVAIGKYPKLVIFGNDYPTRDGTGIRDYIHVDDLALGHLAVIDALRAPGILTLNLGTGRGYSVLEIVRAFERASSRHIPFEIADRRSGDVASCYSDATLAKKLLGWEAKYGIDRMCVDSWRWQLRSA